jgi:hypothetical protein
MGQSYHHVCQRQTHHIAEQFITPTCRLITKIYLKIVRRGGIREIVCRLARNMIERNVLRVRETGEKKIC